MKYIRESKNFKMLNENKMQDYLATIPSDATIYTIHLISQGGKKVIETVNKKDDIGGITAGYDGELIKIIVTNKDGNVETIKY